MRNCIVFLRLIIRSSTLPCLRLLQETQGPQGFDSDPEYIFLTLKTYKKLLLVTFRDATAEISAIDLTHGNSHTDGQTDVYVVIVI